MLIQASGHTFSFQYFSMFSFNFKRVNKGCIKEKHNITNLLSPESGDLISKRRGIKDTMSASYLGTLFIKPSCT
jgi:hypothetical protein